MRPAEWVRMVKCPFGEGSGWGASVPVVWTIDTHCAAVHSFLCLRAHFSLCILRYVHVDTDQMHKTARITLSWTRVMARGGLVRRWVRTNIYSNALLRAPNSPVRDPSLKSDCIGRSVFICAGEVHSEAFATQCPRKLGELGEVTVWFAGCGAFYFSPSSHYPNNGRINTMRSPPFKSRRTCHASSSLPSHLTIRTPTPHWRGWNASIRHCRVHCLPGDCVGVCAMGRFVGGTNRTSHGFRFAKQRRRVVRVFVVQFNMRVY